VWGRWWYTFWIIAAPWLIYTIVMFCFKAMGVNLHIFIIEMPSYTMTLFPTLVHIILFAVFIPWFASTMLVQLRNLELLNGVVIKKSVVRKIKVKAFKIKKRAQRKSRSRRK
jgi:hypothetical protein